MSPVPDLPDADAIAAAVATCPSVSGLSGGIAGEIATYLPGRRVSGVRSNPGFVEVHVVTRYGSPLHEVEAEVRGAVQAAVPGPLTIHVVLADVEDPFAPAEDDQPEEEQEPPALEAGPSASTAALPPAEGAVSSPLSASPVGSSGTAATGSPTTGPPSASVPPPPTAP